MSLYTRFTILAQEADVTVMQVMAQYPIAEAYLATMQERIQRVHAAMAQTKAKPADRNLVFNPQIAASIAAIRCEDKPLADSLQNKLFDAIDANSDLKKALGVRRRNQAINEAYSQMAKATANAKIGSANPIIDPWDMVASMRKFLGHLDSIDDFPLLAYWRNDYYEYVEKRGCYVLRSKEYMTKLMQNFFVSALVERGDKFCPAVNDSKAVDEGLRTLQSLVLVDAPEANVMISPDRSTVPVPRRVMKFLNLGIDLDAFNRGDVHPFIQNSPALFVINSLDIAYDPDATCPKFRQFLHEICDGDQEMEDGLILLMGYILSGDMSLQSIFLFVGLSRSGKGTFLRILSALVGADNVNSTNLSALAKGDFALSALLGKTLVTCTDSHSTGGDSHAVAELLCSISGQDAVTINRKNLPLLPNVKLAVRFILAMNEYVPLPDKAGALLNRLIGYSFNCSFQATAKANLSEEIIAEELAGVANLALDGYRKLSEIRRLACAAGRSEVAAARAAMQPTSGKGILDRMAQLGAPLRVFAEDVLYFDPQVAVDQKNLYLEYEFWCNDNGHQPTGKARFIGDLISAFPQLKERRPDVDDTGHRPPRQVRGVALSTSVSVEDRMRMREDAIISSFVRHMATHRLPPETQALLDEAVS